MGENALGKCVLTGLAYVEDCDLVLAHGLGEAILLPRTQQALGEDVGVDLAVAPRADHPRARS